MDEFVLHIEFIFPQVTEWYREGVCGGGFYEMQAQLMDADGKVQIIAPQ